MTRDEESIAAAYLAIRDRAAKWIQLGPEKAWSRDSLLAMLYFAIDRFREALPHDDDEVSAALTDLGLLPVSSANEADAGKSFAVLRECCEIASLRAGTGRRTDT